MANIMNQAQEYFKQRWQNGTVAPPTGAPNKQPRQATNFTNQGNIERNTGLANPFANPTMRASGFNNNWTNQLQGQVNKMYDAQQQQRLQQFYNARTKGVADLNEAKTQTIGEYAGQRNQADVVATQNMQRMREQMANAGLMASGENVTANISQNNARLQALNALNMQQQQATNQIDKSIRDWNDPNRELEIQNDIATQRNQALYDALLKGKEQANVDRSYERGVLESDRGFEYQKGRDKISDEQWNKQFEREKVVQDREFNEDKRRFEKQFGLDQQKFLYEMKVTEREWKEMSPAEKARMAEEYKYDQKRSKLGGGPGGGSPGGSPGGAVGNIPDLNMNLNDLGMAYDVYMRQKSGDPIPDYGSPVYNRKMKGLEY